MKIIPLFILMFATNLLLAQFYDVVHFQKIDENNGNFNATINTEDWLGYSAESIGDLNRDGLNEIAVSALKDDDGGFNRGAIYILFLNVEGTVNEYQKISSTEGNFNGQLDDWDIFGSSISYLGDMNNDGLIEIGVGAEYDGDGGVWHGAAWILSLNADGTVNSHVKISDTEGNFLAPLGDEDVFGTDIELLGDLDGDGNQDIAVSARRDPDGGSDRGAVYILFLNSDFTVNNYQKISDTAGNFGGNLDAGDYFGGSVANIGDLNGDGTIDIAVGAYRDDDGGSNRGAVYILYLNPDGTVKDFSKISDLEGGFEAEFNDEMFFGKSINMAGDINFDGLTEIIVGAGGFNNLEGARFGTFYILNLTVDGSVDSFVQYTEGLQYFTGDISPGDAFGFSVAHHFVPDVGEAIIAGAYTDSNVGFEKGSFWFIQLGEVLSIEEIDSNFQIKMFPNPSKKSFSLSNIDGIDSIQIFDQSGKRVLNYGSISSNLFDVSYLPIGHYIITATYRNGNYSSYKLIKE